MKQFHSDSSAAVVGMCGDHTCKRYVCDKGMLSDALLPGYAIQLDRDVHSSGNTHAVWHPSLTVNLQMP